MFIFKIYMGHIKLRTPKADYLNKQIFFSIAPFFKMGTSRKGKNLLPEGANSFL